MDQASELFGEFFRGSPVPFFVKDRDGRFVYLNDAAEMLTTGGEGSALGTRYSDHMDSASAAAIAAALDHRSPGTEGIEKSFSTNVVP